jgi:hypothetical protein
MNRMEVLRRTNHTFSDAQGKVVRFRFITCIR